MDTLLIIFLTLLNGAFAMSEMSLAASRKARLAAMAEAGDKGAQAALKLLDNVVELRRAQALKEYYLTHSNEERSRLEALLNVMKIGVLFVDGNQRVVYINHACREIWGLPRDENLAGLRYSSMIDRTAPLRQDDVGYRRHLEEVQAGEEVSGAYEIALHDDRIITDISALVPGEKPGRFIGRVWIYEDVTRQKQLESQLIQLAERDPLTGLYNRRRFHEEIDRILADISVEEEAWRLKQEME